MEWLIRWHSVPNGERFDVKYLRSGSETDAQAFVSLHCSSNSLIPVYLRSSIQVYETPFFVAVDHAKKKVVISIRGTLSPKVNFNVLIMCSQQFFSLLTLADPFPFSTSQHQHLQIRWSYPSLMQCTQTPTTFTDRAETWLSTSRNKCPLHFFT